LGLLEDDQLPGHDAELLLPIDYAFVAAAVSADVTQLEPSSSTGLACPHGGGGGGSDCKRGWSRVATAGSGDPWRAEEKMHHFFWEGCWFIHGRKRWKWKKSTRSTYALAVEQIDPTDVRISLNRRLRATTDRQY
jgi:hypothetical protein